MKRVTVYETPVNSAVYENSEVGSSGMEHTMKVGNFDCLKPQDTVKFVVGSMSDLETVKHILGKYELTNKCGVHLSPVFGKIEMTTIVEFMKQNIMNGVRLQPQLHKIIWYPDASGV
ncbi:MAG: hypothetical protein ACYCYE_10790 [Clostridia bacterium]